MAVEAVRQLLVSDSMAGRFAVGEYFDGNPSALNWWVWQSGMGGRCEVFDFTLHWTIQAMCNNNSNWWMGGLQGAGFIAVDPLSAVTFVDNPDTDLSYGENVIWNKLLGYALILTAEGYPAVYYKDYSTDAGCYGLKPFIDNLIWVHENLAFGDTLTRRGNDPQVYVFERQGYTGLLVALNNDQWNSHPRTVQTSFGPNTQLHDYTGRHPDIWTDGSGQASFTVPRNDHGQSYLCFSRVGYTQAFAFDRRTTTQSLFRAADLDTAPAVNGKPVTAGRLWCQGDTEVVVGFGADTSLWTAEAEILLEIIDAQGKTLAQQGYNTKTLNTMCRAFAHQTGWLVLRVTGQGLAAAGSSYTLTVTYTGAQVLAA